MTYDSGRQAGTEKTEEIEITPEMIQAGLSAWSECEAMRVERSATLKLIFCRMWLLMERSPVLSDDEPEGFEEYEAKIIAAWKADGYIKV
ncbi:hypothetical protein [Hoeflea sp.]|uniref:hypothetical protein n=1 Tax=Hoeflea sp. TaxID=1940281 RepID=UPI003BAF2D48